jgi:hypothetical protein
MSRPDGATSRDGEPHQAFRVGVIAEGTAERRDIEQAIVGRGIPLPFASRAAVVAALPELASAAFFALRDPQGEYAGGFAVQARPAPMGHRLLRVEQLGGSIPIAAADTTVAALRRWAASDPRTLRLSVDVFSFDESRILALGETLRRHGFRRAEHTYGYVETLLLDLTPTEDDLFRALHHAARRKIRQLAGHPVVVRPVANRSLAERMNQLLEETMARTGGRFSRRDWERRIDLSAEHPELSRIVGLFRTDVPETDSLLAFAWGCHGGDHVFYSEAASTRDTGDLRLPLAYGVMWDLIVWAKRTGARWFDLGGITHGTRDSDDPLGGISDFKRHFSQRVARVRDEWILDDHSWRASVASAVHRRLSRILHG